MLAFSAAAGHGWGLTADYLRASFAGPDWTSTGVTETTIHARTAEGELVLPALLLRTIRALPSRH
ncbi:hypothetical protein QLQ12_34430 [Actinoplanes sp. NEAU-A12]|uniref:Uncharacterized protein n=1 Tax=Actinoplanes sandaracinus TaxID=3045177 RepID=A0ABT6WVI2_9ACTN|nr:hypothetical protein [Actinoplanes sandaracinus]MDI6103724.1 hypothetical protein [Actinoplanes sandaracinus]